MMGRLAGGMRQAGRATLDLLLPPRCLTCHASVSDQGELCGACFRRITFITDPACSRCGQPLPSGESRECPQCETSPPVFAAARAAMQYDAAARDLILPLKHADRTALAPVLARHMARAGATLLGRADLLVPVPLHRARLFHRRYNQAALLAVALSRLSKRPTLLDALTRRIATPPLGAKSAGEREATLSGAFTVQRQTSVAGSRVLLIDDVMTSGATANACARVLEEAGATAVDVLVAARVPDPHRESR